VAVIGSLVASVFRRDMAGPTAHLPPPVRDAASSSVSSAYSVAPHLGPLGPRLISAANDSFVTAMHWAAGVAAVIPLGGVFVVLAWLPGTSAPVPPAEPGAATRPEPGAAGRPEPAAAPEAGQAAAGPVASNDDRWPSAFQTTLVNGRTRSR